MATDRLRFIRSRAAIALAFVLFIAMERGMHAQTNTEQWPIHRHGQMGGTQYRAHAHANAGQADPQSPATIGQWSTLNTRMPINPVHAALMPDGKVLVVSGSGREPENKEFKAAIWDPQIDNVAMLSLTWDMFCNGMVVLYDGNPFIIGGTLQYADAYGRPWEGENKTAIFDLSSGNFKDRQPTAHGRWYPTGTTLGDGSVMAYGGIDEVGGTNKSVEIYTVGSGWSPEYPALWTPPGLIYPRMHLLPNGTVFYSGPTINSSIFDPATHTWKTNVGTTKYPFARIFGTSVLLPLLPEEGYKAKVMILGGANLLDTQTTPLATSSTEIIDLSDKAPAWKFGPPMSQPRIELNATILPSGDVLATGGSVIDEIADTASLNADLYSPRQNTFRSAGANAFPRLYHSNALLLPDATVLLLGGNPKVGSYETQMEVYSPAYLFNRDGSLAPRPMIEPVKKGVIAYGAEFQVATPDPSDIKKVVLVRPGAPTHAFDMEQRLVELSFSAGTGAVQVQAPPTGNVAPPGYYLLFILNSTGVPSVGHFVQIGKGER